ncbi:MAG: hypothetical protein KKA65_01995 [Nanoarchaeota archaeon]|nr:hypothetical protein [Nanoarchaeota archaeon]MBU4241661.1 hypothetical protein [Nanoarchaeota archaeon]MBU4352455.1 hypothetical protein [Nanoarchaeota archaeon]MBU4456249.1 hypothetical protein [Nanoarchaeota archaeon]
MSKKNLLVTLKPGDENHYLFRDFLQSLPEDTEKLWDDIGYKGNLLDNIYALSKKIPRNHIIYQYEDSKKLNLDYFANNSISHIKEIKADDLEIILHFEVISKTKRRWKQFFPQYQIPELKDNLAEIIKFYNKLKITPSNKFFDFAMQNKEFKEKFTKKSLFNRKKLKSLGLTYLVIGLSTLDNRYTLDYDLKGTYKLK